MWGHGWPRAIGRRPVSLSQNGIVCDVDSSPGIVVKTQEDGMGFEERSSFGRVSVVFPQMCMNSYLYSWVP